jgi:hypothetical protein
MPSIPSKQPRKRELTQRGRTMSKTIWHTGIMTAVAAALGIVSVVMWQPKTYAGKAAAAVSVGGDDIGGVVTSSKGPEAGVWVIAETTDLPTKYVKIVVTDDQGRYLVPELPKANYKVWVRGRCPRGCQLLSRRLLVFPAEAASQERFSRDGSQRQWNRVGDQEPGPVDRPGKGQQLRVVPSDWR